MEDDIILFAGIIALAAATIFFIIPKQSENVADKEADNNVSIKTDAPSMMKPATIEKVVESAPAASNNGPTSDDKPIDKPIDTLKRAAQILKSGSETPETITIGFNTIKTADVGHALYIGLKAKKIL